MKRAYQLALSIEDQWSSLSDNQRAAMLRELKSELAAISNPEDLALKKISELTRCIKPDMDLKQYYSVLVPIERYFRRKLDDSQFLIYSEDRDQANSAPGSLVVILDNIRSAFNVGAIARICDCVGAKAIYTCGYTSDSSNPQTKKSAMGSDEYIQWFHKPRVEDAILELKGLGYSVFALETAGSQSLYKESLPEKSALILGNERFGIDAHILKMTDGILHIPTFGKKNSLNVAISFSLAAYEWKRQQSPELFI